VGRLYGTGAISRTDLEKSGIEGDTPVDENGNGLDLSPSTTRHEQPGGNLGGPLSKAKYLSATDSAQYREGKVKSTPVRGVKEYLKPCVYNRWKSYGRKAMLDRVPFASWVGESFFAARLSR
jgi:hypothetical protein